MTWFGLNLVKERAASYYMKQVIQLESLRENLHVIDIRRNKKLTMKAIGKRIVSRSWKKKYAGFKVFCISLIVSTACSSLQITSYALVIEQQALFENIICAATLCDRIVSSWSFRCPQWALYQISFALRLVRKKERLTCNHRCCGKTVPRDLLFWRAES